MGEERKAERAQRTPWRDRCMGKELLAEQQGSAGDHLWELFLEVGMEGLGFTSTAGGLWHQGFCRQVLGVV